MSDKAAQKSVPRSPIAVIGVILGLLAARYYPSDPAAAASTPPASESGTSASTTPPASPEPGAILRPLREVLFGEGTPQSLPDLADLKKRLTGPSPASIEILNVMVPDPVNTSLSYRFDETVDSIERALQSRDYILERWRLPWSEAASSPPGVEAFGDAARAASHLAKALGSSFPAPPKPHPAPGDPGLLAFRWRPKLRPTVDGNPERSRFLLAFLIAETPTQGIDRLALSRALGLAEDLRDGPKATTCATGPRAVHILGTYFSGSMPSLRDCLLDWLGQDPPSNVTKTDGEQRAGDANVPAAPHEASLNCRLDSPCGYKIGVVSPASAFDKDGFERAFKDLGKPGIEVEFSSTMHRSETIRRAILEFLNLADGKGVAILTESNTGFGKAVSLDRNSKNIPVDRDSKIVSLQYPLHIAEIRERYESQGLLQDGASDVLKSAGELRGRRESSGKARDVFPDQTSEATAVAQNRVLTQTLQFLEDNRFKAIGIISTDPRDTVFLARLIRRYCPDARVFTVGSDLMYLDPASITDLRGMIVGSTYPLYAPNQAWSGSDEMAIGRVFPSATAQGVYNAAILGVPWMTDGEERRGLLEYAKPLALESPMASRSGQPPIWISVVGERSLYPVDCQSLDASDVNYLAKLPEPGRRGPRPLRINRVSAWMTCFWAITLVLLLAQMNRIHAAFRYWKKQGGAEHSRNLEPDIRWIWRWVMVLAGNLPSIAWRLVFAGGLFIVCTTLATFLLSAGRCLGLLPPLLLPAGPVCGLPPAILLVIALTTFPLMLVAGQAIRRRRGEAGRSGGRAQVDRSPWGWDRILADLSASIVRGLIFAGYLFIACPLLGAVSGSVELNLDNDLAHWLFVCSTLPFFGLVPILAITAPIAEFAGGRRPHALAEAESRGLAILLIFAMLATYVSLYSTYWRLSLDRASAITGGVSPYVPVMFLMLALGSWIYARDRIREINRNLGLGPSAGGKDPTLADIGGYEGVFRDIRSHREGFESWFGEHPGGVPGRACMFVWNEPWKTSWVWTAMIILLAAMLVDATWFRRLSPSDEGALFDLVFRFAFGVVFLLSCLIFALLASAWHDLRAVLAGFAKFPGEVFNRVPKKVSTWFFDPAACRDEYELLIDRQVRAIRSLIDRRPLSEASVGSELIRKDQEARKHLDNLAPEQGQAGGGDSAQAEIESIRYFARELAVHWAVKPVVLDDRQSDKEKGAAKAEPNFDREIIAQMEGLLALHATRWISGALGRIWTLIGFLVVSSLSLLFSITSYPFPEQPRVMTVLGLGIAGLLVIIVRVLIGANRDEVISRVGDTTPGKVTWDAALFGHFGAFIVPLVGVLAAISFDALDLFRAVLGPILRLFH